MRNIRRIGALSALFAGAWLTAGAVWALALVGLATALLALYRRSSTVRRRVSRLTGLLRKQVDEPHPLTIVGVSLLGTFLIVNGAAIWGLVTDALEEPTPAEAALDRQVAWLERASGERLYFLDGSQEAFQQDYERFALDQVQARREPRPQLGVAEIIERQYEFLGREVTVTGDIVNTSDYQDGLIGIWLWDTDEDQQAEVACVVKVDDPDAFVVGRRARIEGLALVSGTRHAGTEYSRATGGLACGRADVLPYEHWSAEEVVDEYIDDLQNSDGWRRTLDGSRQYLIDHFAQFWVKRPHRYDSRGMRRSPVRRLVWALNSFDGRPAYTWGWVVTTADTVEAIGGRRYLRQRVTIEDEEDPTSVAYCDVLRPKERRLREGDWVNATGIVLGSETAPVSGGGFTNAVRMVCAAVRRVGS